MNYVYVIRSVRSGMMYVGRTEDLRRRIKEHGLGKVKSTKKLIPFLLIFYEAFLSKTDAIRREKYLKTTKGKSSLRQMVRDSLEKSCR